jgi:hypothetical protein
MERKEGLARPVWRGGKNSAQGLEKNRKSFYFFRCL